MSHLSIEYPVQLDQEACKEKIDELIEKLQEKYSIDSERIDDMTCRINGSGVDGQINQTDEAIHIKAKLGFFMIPLKSVIEAEIIKQLDKSFT